MTQSRSLHLLMTVLLALGIAGCSAIAPTSGGAQQGVDNKVITIGLASVMSGPSASASQISDGTKVYLDMLNRDGGVNGYTFKYLERL
jgi:ABC-type branched-subunit amino acid transport system substrate-binding protein